MRHTGKKVLSPTASAVFAGWVRDGIFCNEWQHDKFIKEQPIEMLEFLTRDAVRTAMESGGFISIYHAADFLTRHDPYIYESLLSDEMSSLLNQGLFSAKTAVYFLHHNVTEENWKTILTTLAELTQQPVFQIISIADGIASLNRFAHLFPISIYTNDTKTEKQEILLSELVNRLCMLELSQSCDDNAIESLRKDLQHILLFSQEDIRESAFFDTIYLLLITLAELKPIDCDPYTLESTLAVEDRVVISTGHQFNIHLLVGHQCGKANTDTPGWREYVYFDPSGQMKRFENPLTCLPFSRQDQARVLLLAMKKGIGIQFPKDTTRIGQLVCKYADEIEAVCRGKTPILVDQMDRLFRERIKELATFITEDAIAQLPVIMRHRLLYYTDAVINLVFRGKLLELPALLSLQTAELDAMWCCTDDLRILIEKKIFTFSDVMALDIEPRKEVLVSCYFLIKATEKNVCTLDEIAEYFSNHTPTACLGYFSRESWAYNISRIFDEDRFCQFKDVACLNEETLSELALYRKQVSRLVHVHKIPFLEIAEANPDQFKHFLALAETNAEKSAQQTKRTTPGVQQFQLPPPDPSDAAVVANTAPVVSI